MEGLGIGKMMHRTRPCLLNGYGEFSHEGEALWARVIRSFHGVAADGWNIPSESTASL